MVKVTERPEKVLEIAKFEAFAVAGSRQKSEKNVLGSNFGRILRLRRKTTFDPFCSPRSGIQRILGETLQISSVGHF